MTGMKWSPTRRLHRNSKATSRISTAIWRAFRALDAGCGKGLGYFTLLIRGVLNFLLYRRPLLRVLLIPSLLVSGQFLPPLLVAVFLFLLGRKYGSQPFANRRSHLEPELDPNIGLPLLGVIADARHEAAQERIAESCV